MGGYLYIVFIEIQMDFKRTKGIIPSLACALTRLCTTHDFANVRQTPPSVFDSYVPPRVSLLDFIIKIYKYSQSSYKSHIYAFIYIDRLIYTNDLIVNSYNIHRLVITSFMIASKFIDDRGFNNEFHSQISGISLEEITTLEVEFLFLMNFNLVVDEKECKRYEKFLQSHPVIEKCPCACDRNMVDSKLPDKLFQRRRTKSRSPIIRSAFTNKSHAAKINKFNPVFCGAVSDGDHC